MNEDRAPNPGRGQPAALDVSVKVYPHQDKGNLLATASVTLGGCFAIRGVRIMDSEKGAFVAMPDRKDAKGEYHDICFPTTAEMRAALNSAVLGEYQRTVQRTFNRAGQAMEKTSARAALRNAQHKAAARPAPAQDVRKPVDKGAR